MPEILRELQRWTNPAEHPGLFAAYFVVMWVVVCYLLSIFGGWRMLAERYRSTGNVAAAYAWRGQSGTLRLGLYYRGCLTIETSSEGLRLRVFLPIRPGHAPLFIPWPDLSAQPAKGLIRQYVDLSFADVPNVTLRLRHDLGHEILECSGQLARLRSAA
jgi:hypothetical protein